MTPEDIHELVTSIVELAEEIESAMGDDVNNEAVVEGLTVINHALIALCDRVENGDFR